MMLHGLSHVLLLLNVLSLIAANDIGNTLLDFKNDTVRGIYLYGTNVIGVALDKDVYIGRIENGDIAKPIRIPLDRVVSVDDTGDYPLLEFKLINESRVLACTAGGCSVCSQSADSSPNCYHIPLSKNLGKLSSVSAALVNEDIVLRAVRDKGNATIYYFVPNESEHAFEDSGRRANDATALSDITTVAAFSTPKHSYFVGSARRRDLALMSIKPTETRVNTEIRITRICNGDETTRLASRIDLVLSCEGIQYNNVNVPIINKATAATYLPDSARLLVAFQQGVSGDQNFICSYNFTELQSRFTNTWKQCQSTTNAKATEMKCKRNHAIYATLEDFCFLFSWDYNARLPFCSAYNGYTGEEQFDNCELHQTKSTSNAYGSLENFKQYDGSLLFRENHTSPIVAIREIPNEGALYALREDKHVIRLLTGNESSVLASIPGKSGKHMLEVLPKSRNVLFVPARFERSISSFTSSCEGIYKTCQSTAWNDPLHCLYCAENDGTGVVVADKTACPNNAIYENACPPTITGATRTDNGEYHISGENFNILSEPVVTVCEDKCDQKFSVDPTIIRCSTGKRHSENCLVSLKGALDSNYKNITLSKLLPYPDPETTVIPQSDKPKSNSFVLKVVIFVVVLVGLLMAICFIYVCISRHGATRFPKGKPYTAVKSDILHLNHIAGHLNPNDLTVLSQSLGEGNSAIVHKGLFNTSAVETIPVAVKIFKIGYADSTDEELQMLCKVRHTNIVGFIGHTYINDRLHIVTEFMAGGSLLQYIKNENNLLKYQNTFDYMDQIFNAMVYLTQQHIIHRDLAARNCLLNGDYTILKVSDFGLARSANAGVEYEIQHKDTALPSRWIAIETFSLKNVTEKTDVWSFAVLVWELFTRGRTPYEELQIHEVRPYLEAGHRLYCPDTCPEPIYKLLISCWDAEPERRPSFKELQKQMSDTIAFITNSNKQLVDTGYERPRSQAFTPNGSKAITVV